MTICSICIRRGPNSRGRQLDTRELDRNAGLASDGSASPQPQAFVVLVKGSSGGAHLLKLTGPERNRRRSKRFVDEKRSRRSSLPGSYIPPDEY